MCSGILEGIMESVHAFRREKDMLRKNLITYTRKAFRMLPRLEDPRILDIGCGSGIPTIELAHLCNGQILAVDIDQSHLNSLEEKISEAGLSDRVHTLNCSLFHLDFPDEDFDVIWSEGSFSPLASQEHSGSGVGFSDQKGSWSFTMKKRILQKNATRYLVLGTTLLAASLCLVIRGGESTMGH